VTLGAKGVMASLAKSIRSDQDDQDLDLGGYGAAQIADLMTLAFKEPIVASKMLRISFTVGGGKKVRQKYGDDMPKWCREALRAIGFEEDRGACNVMECAGQFKYQHDTDKDLKFIHVFPRIDTAAAAAAAAADEDEEEEEVTIAGMKLDELPPEHLCTIVSMETFGRLVAAQCPSFSQRRALLKAMKEMQARFTSFEERMTNMQQLSKDEDELYNSAQDLPEKIAQLEKQLEGMMTGGHLTRSEMDNMIRDFSEKLVQVEDMVDKAKASGKGTDKLEANKKVLGEKIDFLKAATPVVHRKKNEREIITLRRQLQQLEKIENTKGLVPLEEMKKLNQKPAIVARLAELEEEGKGWFDGAIPNKDKVIAMPPPQMRMRRKRR